MMRRIAPGGRDSSERVARKFNKFAGRVFRRAAGSCLEMLFEYQIGHTGFSGNAHLLSDRKRCL